MSSSTINDWPRWPRVADTDAVLRGFREILESKVWTVRAPGPAPCVTEAVEHELARLFGARHALLVASGTVAVELAVRALKLPEGAKVIVPALGWFATAAAVRRAGAKPVFVDVLRETSCLDPARVESSIDSRVGAIVAVHLHCAAADLDRLSRIAEQHRLALIEDCAQAHGTIYGGRHVGNIGRIGCFSFNQEKLIAVGEGGCVITSDDELYHRLYALRTDGFVAGGNGQRSFQPHGAILGGNACASEFVAVLARAQIRDFAALNTERRRIANALINKLAGIPGVTPLKTAPGTDVRSWHEFAFRLDPQASGGWTAAQCGEFLTEELGFPIHQTDEPTQECPMLDSLGTGQPAPSARDLYETLLVFHHRILLDERIVEALPRALRRLRVDARSGRRKAQDSAACH